MEISAEKTQSTTSAQRMERAQEIKKFFPSLKSEANSNTNTKTIQENHSAKFVELHKAGVALKKSRNVTSPDLKVAQATKISERPTNQRLFDASVELQSILVEQMLGAMRQATASISGEDRLFKRSFQEQVFTEMLYREYARELSKSSQFDLAEQIYRQLAPDHDLPGKVSDTHY